MAIRWEAGAHVVVRNVWHGRVFSAYPLVPVEDTADLVVLFIPKHLPTVIVEDRHPQT